MSRPLAPHVRAAIQAKPAAGATPAPATSARGLASHVRAAIQAKPAASGPQGSGKPSAGLAPHVQAKMAFERPPAAKAPSPRTPGVHPPTGTVQPSCFSGLCSWLFGSGSSSDSGGDSVEEQDLLESSERTSIEIAPRRARLEPVAEGDTAVMSPGTRYSFNYISTCLVVMARNSSGGVLFHWPGGTISSRHAEKMTEALAEIGWRFDPGQVTIFASNYGGSAHLEGDKVRMRKLWQTYRQSVFANADVSYRVYGEREILLLAGDGSTIMPQEWLWAA